jgi:hypothetical protein
MRQSPFIHPSDLSIFDAARPLASFLVCSLLLLRRASSGSTSANRRSAGACTAGCWAASGWRRSRSSRRRCCCCCRSWRLLLLRATAPLLLGRLPARLPLPLGPSPAAAAALLEGHCGWRVLCLAGEYIIIIITIIHGDERRSRARGGSLFSSVTTCRHDPCRHVHHYLSLACVLSHILISISHATV